MSDERSRSARAFEGALGIYLEHAGIGLDETVAYARRAEDAGYNLIASGDGYADNFALLGAVAAVTSKVRLVSAVANLTRTPITTAVGARTLADISRGRYLFGLGVMSGRWSERWHGIPGADPVGRMRDFVLALHAAWSASDGPTSYDGEHYSFKDYRQLHSFDEQPPRVALAAARPRITALAGEIADGVVFSSILQAATLRSRLLPVLERGLDASERPRSDLEVGVVVSVALAETTQEARTIARGALLTRLPPYADLFKDEPFRSSVAQFMESRDASAISDGLVDELGLTGTVDEVRSCLVRYRGLVDWVVLMPPVGLSQDDGRDQIERLMEVAR